MPTRRGSVAIAGAAGLYVLARLVSATELYALSAAALVFPVLAVVFVRLRAHRLVFTRTVAPRRVFAGGTVRIGVVARNEGRATSPPLVLEDAAPAGVGGPVRLVLAPIEQGRTEPVSAERTVAVRGRYALGPMRARLLDPFGLAQASREVAGTGSLVVYPRIEALSEGSPPEARATGGQSLHHRLATAGDEFYGVRGWQEGDDLRKIHWRSSARRGELMIRQEEVRPFPRATILVDTRGTFHAGAGPSSSVEWALSGAASVVWELARQGFSLRLATAEGGPGGARWGREAAEPLLASLATVGAGAGRSLTPVVRRLGARASAGGALIAFLPPPTPDSIGPLSRLRRAYSWCGAVLLDVASFGRPSGRERASYDQRIAEADRALARAGWRVTVAGSSDPFPLIWQTLVWQTLLAAGASHPSLPSPRS